MKTPWPSISAPPRTPSVAARQRSETRGGLVRAAIAPHTDGAMTDHAPSSVSRRVAIAAGLAGAAITAALPAGHGAPASRGGPAADPSRVGAGPTGGGRLPVVFLP